MRVGLVDADLLCFTAAVKAQESHDLGFDDDTPMVRADPGAALRHVLEALETWTEDARLDRVELCWSDPVRRRNWRLDVLPTYKHGRSGEKPLLYWWLAVVMNSQLPAHYLPSLEGDDVMGIMQTGPFGRRQNTVILSIDKDMRTVPGELFDWHREFHGTVTPDEAALFHMTQTLTGDPTDGYTGLPGCGPKRAEKVLSGLTGYAELWYAVVAEYERKGLTEADALVQARVSRILHRSDWDAKSRQPILWTPPA